MIPMNPYLIHLPKGVIRGEDKGHKGGRHEVKESWREA
jgi:hypothetical protein